MALVIAIQSLFTLPPASAKNESAAFNAVFGSEKSFPLSDHIGTFDQNRSYELSSLIELSLTRGLPGSTPWPPRQR